MKKSSKNIMKNLGVTGVLLFLFLSFESYAEERVGSFFIDSFVVGSSSTDAIKNVSATAKGSKLILSYECIGFRSHRDRKLKILVKEITATLFGGVAIIDYHAGRLSDRFLDDDVSLYDFRSSGEKPRYSNDIDATDLVFIEDVSKAEEVVLTVTLLKSLEKQELVFSVTDRISVDGFSSAVAMVNAQCVVF